MKAPLEMIALDHDGPGYLAIPAALEFRPNVDQQGAEARRIVRGLRGQANERSARPIEKLVEGVQMVVRLAAGP